MNLDKILNLALNKALIGKDRIKQINSNEIANFVNKYLETINYTRVVNCKHEDYTPCYGREGELMFKECDTCGEDFD